MKRQNKDIQFFKFVYSWIIVLFHIASNTGISCRGGYYAVEYYLLAAGVFVFLAFQRGESSGKIATPAQYLKKGSYDFYLGVSRRFC